MIFSKTVNTVVCVLAGATFFSGCASYTPVLVKPEMASESARKATNDGVTMLAEEYGSSAKSAKAFDANLVDDGVLPLLISLTNESGKALNVDTAALTVSDSSGVLKQLNVDEASAKSKKNAWGRALGWSMIIPIISIPIAATASVMHTNKVNQKRYEDFLAKALNNGQVASGKEAFGFVFVEIDPKRTKWDDLKVEFAAKLDGQAAPIMISTPLAPIVFVPTNAPRQ
jgi:hypothetical protein